MNRGLISAMFHSQRAVEALVVAKWVDYAPMKLHSVLFETTIGASNASSSEKSPNARKEKKRKTNKKKAGQKERAERGRQKKPFLTRAALPS